MNYGSDSGSWKMSTWLVKNGQKYYLNACCSLIPFVEQQHWFDDNGGEKMSQKKIYVYIYICLIHAQKCLI